MAKAPRLDYIAEALRPLAFPVEKLVLDPHNDRDHPDDQIELLIEALPQFGIRKPCVARQKTKVVTAGNGLVMACRRLRWAHVPTVFIDENDQLAREYALFDNRSGERSTWNWDTLAQHLAEIHQRDPERLTFLGWRPSEADPILAHLLPYDPKVTTGKLGAPDPTLTRAVSVSPEQRVIFEEACERVRTNEGDDQLSEGRCLELICGDFLAGR